MKGKHMDTKTNNDMTVMHLSTNIMDFKFFTNGEKEMTGALVLQVIYFSSILLIEL